MFSHLGIRKEWKVSALWESGVAWREMVSSPRAEQGLVQTFVWWTQSSGQGWRHAPLPTPPFLSPRGCFCNMRRYLGLRGDKK